MNIADKVLRAKDDFNAVFDAGKQAEYDMFWDSFQENGNKTTYNYAFANGGWDATTFKPKYDIKPKSAQYMFYTFSTSDDKLYDLKSRLDSLGVKLDFSQCTAFNSCFAYSHSQNIGVVDTRSASSITGLFAYWGYGRTIEKLILKDDGSQSFANNFNDAKLIKHMIVEGVIGKNGFNVQWLTTLDKESITSIVNALSTTTSGLTVTLSKTAIASAFGITSTQVETPTEGSEWYMLRHSKDNWTFSYV